MSNSRTQIAKISIDVLAEWKNEFIERVRLSSNSKKPAFEYNDAVKLKNCITERDGYFIIVEKFLNSNPLRNNDYSKYVSCYINEGKKLNPKYFRNDINKLEEYYTKVDEAKSKVINYNPFSELAYGNYVLYMVLKLNGQYSKTDDSLFNVEVKDSREYNPLSKIPSVLRGELPFHVKEYDIKRAFPTFIDIELDSNYRKNIYEKIDKKTFAILLNSNNSNPKSNIDKLRKSLSVVYGKDAENVLTDERFEAKGKAFLDFSKYEKQYVEQFVLENKLAHYVRLHDGVFVLSETVCDETVFEIVEFSIKECIKPVIENETVNFYTIDNFGKVVTSRTMYADFFKQEKFKRISIQEDRLLLLLDTNNVIEFFNYKTNIVSFLEGNINENLKYYNMIREVIAKECNSIILNSFNLIPHTKLVYYSDTKTGFGLPFKNGFFYFDTNVEDGAIKCKEYTDVEGFFPPHNIQTRDFEYTDEVGMFEQFLTRSATNKISPNTHDTKYANKAFQCMFGYLCHSYKNQVKSPCIILTDENANDENRNGGRGKSLLTKALSKVQTQLFKGGNEFNPSYQFVFDDLEKKHKSYVIDDVSAGFKYDDLYTNISSGINCHKKGKTAELIPFEESPKFVITTNWVIRYDEKDASTNRRFIEYKFSNYYNKSRTPKDDFECTFFEEWDDKEWNRFYSFVFRCVKLFFENGLYQIPYDKDKDNYNAYFNNPSMIDEFERIIKRLLETKSSFRVNDFLNIYNAYENPMKIEKFFHQNNAKKLIDIWLIENKTSVIDWAYQQNKRKWIYQKSEKKETIDKGVNYLDAEILY